MLNIIDRQYLLLIVLQRVIGKFIENHDSTVTRIGNEAVLECCYEDKQNSVTIMWFKGINETNLSNKNPNMLTQFNETRNKGKDFEFNVIYKNTGFLAQSTLILQVNDVQNYAGFYECIVIKKKTNDAVLARKYVELIIPEKPNCNEAFYQNDEEIIILSCQVFYNSSTFASPIFYWTHEFNNSIVDCYFNNSYSEIRFEISKFEGLIICQIYFNHSSAQNLTFFYKKEWNTKYLKSLKSSPIISHTVIFISIGIVISILIISTIFCILYKKHKHTKNMPYAIESDMQYIDAHMLDEIASKQPIPRIEPFYTLPYKIDVNEHTSNVDTNSTYSLVCKDYSNNHKKKQKENNQLKTITKQDGTIYQLVNPSTATESNIYSNTGEEKQPTFESAEYAQIVHK